MSKIKIGIIIAALILLIVSLFRIDYKNPAWSNNKKEYGAIISMICCVFAMLI